MTNDIKYEMQSICNSRVSAMCTAGQMECLE